MAEHDSVFFYQQYSLWDISHAITFFFFFLNQNQEEASKQKTTTLNSELLQKLRYKLCLSQTNNFQLFVCYEY